MASPLGEFLSAQERSAGIIAEREARPQMAAQRDVALERQKLALGGDQRGQKLQSAQLFGNFIAKVKQMPDPAQRLQTFEAARPELAQFDIDLPTNLTLESVTDEGLAPLEASLAGFYQPPPGKFQRGQGAVVDTEQGQAFATPVFDPRTGSTRVDVAPIGQTILTREGETVQQRTLRLAEEARLKERAKLGEQEQAKPRIEAAIAREKQRAQSGETRDQAFIDDGLDSAEALPTINRTLELLNFVGTGGFDAALLRAKQSFGVEGADEGELSANLGKAVLSQLRQTFGAAFTEREGARLESIEAGFGKSPATNRRLLGNLKELLERKARRGMEAAYNVGRPSDAEEIQSLLDFRVGQEAPAQDFDIEYDPATGTFK